MKLPFGLLGAGVAVWSVATAHWVAGVLIAVCLEGPRFLKTRWEFGPREFERITDLTTIAFAVFLVWQWVTLRTAGDAVVSMLVWAPAFLAPLLFMQRMSDAGVVPLTALFWSMRKRAARGDPIGSVAMDPAYLCVCLLSGASGAAAGRWFLPAVIAVAALALFQARPRPRGTGGWGFAMLAAVGVALLLQAGLLALQQQVEAWVLDYLRGRLAGRHDASRGQTAIGDIGTLKLSDRILYRVETPSPGGIRLRDGVFDTFSYDTWFARAASGRKGQPDGEFGWRLAPGEPTAAVRISAWLTRGQAVLPVPAQAVRLDALNVGQVDVDGYGTVRVRQGPDLVRYRAEVDPRAVTVEAPGAADLTVSPRLAPALDAFLAEARGPASGDRAVAASVAAYLRDRFRYTTRLTANPGERRTLEAFLTRDRAGHCEYFATAAALVLRRAGIPTRYVTGYVADEWSGLEKAYVVRARHGHAWTLAWIDGRWQDIDATPSGWWDAEAQAQPAIRGWIDTLSWLRFRWSAWNADAVDDSRPSLWWLVVVLPLAFWVGRGVVKRSRRTAVSAPDAVPSQAERSPAAALLDALARQGRERAPSVSVSRFLDAVPMPEGDLQDRLRAFARRYRQWRFDPGSRGDGDDAALDEEGRALAAALSRDGQPGAGTRP